ncbi:hypothetical protein [Selenomonas ruminantium]|uniref:Uncharacterized protein n=1 Tax=Selenomonas ruminantium TaxID=971 RepID=A0A1I0WK90_SELRU|nr:hypothetical protein [Selenomonas ruminantium]SFA89205.1 hypothetical protein SAMN05216587_10374 [Selenomonas ruminantium]
MVELSAYADDDYFHEQEENYANYEVGRKNAEERFQNLRDISNAWEKNTFTNVADIAISSQHIFTSETVTPFAKANINTVAEGAVFGIKSAKTVVKSSVVGLTFAAADTYDDVTNENFTAVQKAEAVGIDLAGAAAGIVVGAILAPASLPVGIVGGIVAGFIIDQKTNQFKEKAGLKNEN